MTRRPGRAAGSGGGTSARSGPPYFDPYDTLPELAPLRTALTNADWTAVQAYFSTLDSAEKISFVSGLVADTPGVEDMLRKAVAEQPAAPLPRTLLAHRYVGIGWDIRTGALADSVSREQFDRFHGWLEQAEQILIDVCAEQPAYAPAWTVRLLTARGLELDQAEVRRRYDRLSAHHPHHYPAQQQLLQQLCPKWGGSWETAHDFARGAASASPDGSHSGALVALAHLEHVADLEPMAAYAYLRGVPVRDDLRFAARVSVLHRDYRPGFHGIGAHSAFALAFSMGGHFEDALLHFGALGDRADASVWSYVPDPSTAFLKYRKSATATI